MYSSFVGGEIDKLAETKGRSTWSLHSPAPANRAIGMNEYDKLRAQHQAKESAHHMYDEHYERGQGADQYDPNQYDRPQQFQGGGYGY